MLNNIKDAVPQDMSVFHSYASDTGPDPKVASDAIKAIEPIFMAKASDQASWQRTYRDTSRSVSYASSDMNSIRLQEMITAANDAYYDEGLGLLRNVIDMMSSFGAQGIKIVHPNKKKQKFYNAWAKVVDMSLRSERFLNLLYRTSNVVVKRNVAKLTQRQLQDMYKATASYGADVDFRGAIKPNKNEIPIDYTFLNVSCIDTVHGDLAAFLGKPVYTLRIPNTLMLTIKTPKSPSQRELVNMLPNWIRDPVKKGQRYIPLDEEMITVHHYMKDDWMQWAVPLTHSIMTDLRLYKQMKQADAAALDGVINSIRIWNVGSLEHKIQPGAGAITALQDILLSNKGNSGPLNLVWDDTLRLHETKTDAHHFLGSSKYEPILRGIYAGLGIPQSLTGGSSQGAGFTNNAISVKTLVERLDYGRQVLNRWWYRELEVIRKAIGDKQEPIIVYDHMNLYDEAAEKMLWVQLYDRYLVSDETIQENFGMIPEVEERRIAREAKSREDGRRQPKAGPFFEAQPEHQMTKIALQQGVLAPTEAGVVKKPRGKGDKSLIDLQQKQADKQLEAQKEAAVVQAKQNADIHKQKLRHKDEEHKAMLPIKQQVMKESIKSKKKGQPGQGRPSGSKDSSQRKARRVLPRSKASELVQMSAWARGAQKAIAESVTPIMLDKFGRKNVRSLSGDQVAELEKTKLAVLWATEPYTKVDAGHISNVMAASLPLVDEITSLTASLMADTQLAPTADNLREMQVSAYSILKGETDGEIDADSGHGD